MWKYLLLPIEGDGSWAPIMYILFTPAVLETEFKTASHRAALFLLFCILKCDIY